MENTKNPVSEIAIASLVMGIMSWVHIFNMEKGIIAIIFGVWALNKIKQNTQLDGKKFAWIGIVLGILYIVVTTVMTIKYAPQMMQMQQRMMQQSTQQSPPQ